MSYIIFLGEVIARTPKYYKDGHEVLFSKSAVPESLDASREYNLVNLTTGVISNDCNLDVDPKYDDLPIAREFDEGEFYIGDEL